MSGPSSPRSPDGTRASAGLAPPIFIACTARSGSTLLRFLLDTHPEIAAPGESDVAVVLRGYTKMAADLGTSQDGAASLAGARQVAEDLVVPYLAARGRTRWCDKSLSNVFHLPFLADIWPEARFVMLYRHCADVVMSGIEVSPWGLSEFGFAQVAQASPTDSVVALSAYWVDRTARMLAFEEAHPASCLRVRYEDLVTSPEETLGVVFEFLNVAPVEGIAERSFSTAHSSLGAADFKIWYTDHVRSDAVGRGARVPAEHIVGPLRANLNALLGRLAYQLVDDDWGAGDLPLAAYGDPPDEWADSPLLELRVVEGHAVRRRATVDLSATTGGVLPADAPGTLPFVVVIEQAVLGPLLDTSYNAGEALRNRTMRWYGRLPRLVRDEAAVVTRLLEILRADKTLRRTPH